MGAKMKWYKRDPSAYLAGTRMLTPEQRGIYNDVLELLYARDGDLPDNDRFMSRCCSIRPQTWRRIKGELMNVGKICVENGKLTANRVQTEVISARKLIANMT